MILDIAEEVIAGYIWECNIRNYTQADHWKDKKSLYITQFDLGYPEKQYSWDSNDCHAKGLFKNVFCGAGIYGPKPTRSPIRSRIEYLLENQDQLRSGDHRSKKP